ncbi:PucR family transcriptional regulator [Ligilactobacillus acidipiscis]|uniref:PucR family transcriptional regulator n=1 Tax=Ligilactobacillus acidipiscis TaxID=89059 RepID=UPI0023F9EF52|nr:helix-turn-helix domain-containing protein [Ligilactobacillus acidipiscis]WEV56213.1 helix-turn-helix domain-containing protein [Ligilactobacillus acidipiscis]
MNLPLDLLVDELEQQIFYHTQLPEITIEDIQFFPSDEQHCLVILNDEKELKELRPRQIAIATYATFQQEPQDLIKLPVIIFKEDLDLAEMFAQVGKVFKKYDQWEKKVFRALVEEKNINSFFKICVQILKNPTALFDNQWRMITYENQGKSITDEYVWSEIIQNEAFPLENYSFLADDYSLVKLSEKKDVYTYPIGDSGKNMMNATIREHGKRIMYIGSTDVIAPFDTGQVFLLKKIKIAMEGFCNRTSSEIMPLSDHNFWLEIIQGKDIEEHEIFQHLQQYEWPKDPIYCVFCLSLEDVLGQPSSDYYYRSKIEEEYHHSVVIIDQKNIVALVPASNSEKSKLTDLKQINEFFKELKLPGGISFVHYQLGDISSAYQQAKYALSCNKDGQVKMIRFYDVYQDYVFHVLELSQTDLHILYLPELQYLENYDHAHGDELLKTLETYLMCHYNAEQTSKELVVNRNTVRYRLNKIKKLTQLAIEDPKLLMPMEATLISMKRSTT